MITTLFETCFFSGKRVNVALNDCADLGCLWDPGHCPSQSLRSLGAFQNTLQKHLKKLVKTYLDILDHTAAYCCLMSCARFNIQAGQLYLRLACSCEKQPVSMLVIVPIEYFASLLKWAPISCLQSSHRVFSPQKRPAGLPVVCCTATSILRGEEEEGRQREGRAATLPGGRERIRFLWVVLCTQTYFLIRTIAHMTLHSL